VRRPSPVIVRRGRLVLRRRGSSVSVRSVRGHEKVRPATTPYHWRDISVGRLASLKIAIRSMGHDDRERMREVGDMSPTT
jgi:hypothetical protein